MHGMRRFNPIGLPRNRSTRCARSLPRPSINLRPPVQTYSSMAMWLGSCVAHLLGLHESNENKNNNKLPCRGAPFGGALSALPGVWRLALCAGVQPGSYVAV